MFYGAKAETFATAHLLRKNMTLEEVILWKKLNNRVLFNVKFRRQHPIDFFIVDFYNHDLKLVIEIDGEIHDSKESVEYDQSRTGQLEQYGLTVVRFTNDEVLYQMGTVISRIQKVITELGPL
jgi:very-short-patch-repair endonuclease